jgi:tetratricopeptide (TPR) repeat protein
MKYFVLCIFLLVSTEFLSGQQWQWPDAPKNMTVLPSTVTGRELQRTMFTFTGALGVRCIHCHIGEEGKDFKEWDFASDAKPAKNKARLMITMTKNINTKFLADLHEDGISSIQVNCQTCHRGASRPLLLEERLKETFDATGIDSTIKLYRALREQLYGGYTYNFKEGTLLRLADKIAVDSTKKSAAMEIIKLNIEMYPSFAFSYTHMASYYEDAGNIPAAIENYKTALSLSPDNERIKKQLAKLQGK